MNDDHEYTRNDIKTYQEWAEEDAKTRVNLKNYIHIDDHKKIVGKLKKKIKSQAAIIKEETKSTHRNTYDRGGYCMK